MAKIIQIFGVLILLFLTNISDASKSLYLFDIVVTVNPCNSEQLADFYDENDRCFPVNKLLIKHGIVSRHTFSVMNTRYSVIYEETHPEWLDESRILYLGRSFGYERDIAIYNLATQENRIIYHESETGTTDFSVAPKQSSIAIRSNNDLLIYSLTTEELTAIDVDVTDEFFPHKWSPDGQYLSLMTKERELAVVHTDGTGYHVLNPESHLQINAYSHQWLNDSELVVTADYDEKREIFVISRDGSQVRQLTNNDVEEYDLNIAPNGDWIMYSVEGQRKPSGGTGSYGNHFANSLHMVSSDGSQVVNILPMYFYNSFRWLPNGEGIAFKYYLNTTAKFLVENGYSGGEGSEIAWIDLGCLDIDKPCSIEDVNVVSGIQVAENGDFDIRIR